MLTIEQCREILGDDVHLSDERLERLRDELYRVADVVTEHIATTAPSLAREAGLEAALALLPEEEREDVAERAAIMEFEGGTPADKAERAAVALVIRRRRDRG